MVGLDVHGADARPGVMTQSQTSPRRMETRLSLLASDPIDFSQLTIVNQADGPLFRDNVFHLETAQGSHQTQRHGPHL